MENLEELYRTYKDGLLLPEVTKVKVIIGRTAYKGIRYWEGLRVEYRYILLGNLPASHGRAYYRIPGDNRDWFIGAYWQEAENTENWRKYAPYNPGGKSFMLCPWTVIGSIDDPSNPKRRMTIQAEEL